MSGFEVVGVVLGAIPLVISALEHYSEGVRSTLLSYEEIADSYIPTRSQQ
jgi:hypothetical protein